MTSKVEYYFYSGNFIQFKYWKNEEGLAHREDGPAYEYVSGARKWYKNGLLHREDGPALVWGDGFHEYYLNNEQYSKEEYWKEIEKITKERERKRNDFKGRI